MNKHLTTCLYLSVLFIFSCQNDQAPSSSVTDESPAAVMLKTEHIEKKEGDCEAGNYESKCAQISLSFPVVTKGVENLKKSVSNWANDFMTSMLDPGLGLDQETSLESAIQSFIEMHREMTLEMPDMPGYYTVEVTDTILMLSDKYLTLRLDGYSYTGGAHPNAFAAISTFDLKTGRAVGVEDLVSNLDSLKIIAEQRFRAEQQEAFADGFEFTESWPFKIADNVGLTTEGLYFCYVPYEVAPYVMGFTEFVVPFEAIEVMNND